MKLIYAFVTLVLVGIKLSSGEVLKCLFEDFNYAVVGILYRCKVTSLENINNNMIINGNTGVHMTNQDDDDVKAIRMKNTNTKFIPENLGSVFNLKALTMWNTQLIEIKSNDFKGMQELEHLYLGWNELFSLSFDVFSNLPKLRFIVLSYNKIQELPKGLFDNNLDLEEIHLDDNKMKSIVTGMFDNLRKLSIVNLRSNICINKQYQGASGITQLKNDIKENCMNPIEVLASTTNTTTTTQNPLVIQNIELKEKIQKLEKELLQAKRNATEANGVKCEEQFVMNVNVGKTMINNGKLNCSFSNVQYGGSMGQLYSCSIRSLNILHNNITITGYRGSHKTDKSDNDVQGISIFGNDIKYIPADLGSLFNLTAFEIDSAKLMEIKSSDFKGMQNLEFLNLGFNKLSSISTDEFRILIKLKVILLSRNELEILPNGVFSFNSNLERIYLDGNKIKFIGSNLFHRKPKLIHVSLNGNICVNALYDGSRDIIALRAELKLICKNN